MHIILGATGHIGSEVAATLLKRKEPATVITRNPEKAREWEERGAKAVVADIYDTDKFVKVLNTGDRLFLVNPPAPPDTDTVEVEEKSLRAIIQAVASSGIEKVVAQSTYGAQPGRGIGDLGVLYQMEQSLSVVNISTTIIRGAYFMSNWDSSLESARNEGKIYSFYPANFKLPMAAPADIGRIAAAHLMDDGRTGGIHYVEGPARYSPADVAAAFSSALAKPVQVEEIPREQWVPTMIQVGFSESAARSMAAMTAITLEQGGEIPESPTLGKISIGQYVRNLVTTHSH